MGPMRDDESLEATPSSSRIAARVEAGPMGALAAHAGAALVREEIAHVLSAPLLFFGRIVGQLEEGQPISPENVEIAREEVDRMQRLVSSLRTTPSIRTAARPIRLESVVHATCRDFSAARGAAEVQVRVASEVVVSVDTTALGFVVFSVLGVLGSHGAERVRVELAPEPGVNLVFLAEPGGDLDASVFASGAWASGDGHALIFAIARRVARMSSMRLRSPRPSAGGPSVRLELPTA